MIMTRRAAMIADLFDILVDGRAIQIHRGSHRRCDGRCSKDQSERPDTALLEDIHVQPSVLNDQGKRLKYRFVPAYLRTQKPGFHSSGRGWTIPKMKGSRLLPKNLPPNASPPAIGGAMLTSRGFCHV
jgi:hypothetical protein